MDYQNNVLQAKQRIDFLDKRILEDNDSISDSEIEENSNAAESKIVADFKVHSNNELLK